jgi:hypothetical protein
VLWSRQKTSVKFVCNMKINQKCLAKNRPRRWLCMWHQPHFFLLVSGLPDFLWHNIPKQRNIYQIATNLPNGHEMYQMPIIYCE